MNKRILRRLLQASVIVTCIAIMFACGGGIVAEYLTRSSPLMAITTRIAARSWVKSFCPAILLVLLGLIWPRFFCGWVCPLGTLIDCTGYVWDRTIPRSPLRPNRYFKLLILFLIIAVAFTSVELSGWLDPLALLARGIDGSSISSRDGIYRLLAVGERNFWTGQETAHQIRLLAIIICAFAIGLTIRGKRAWCRAVCPHGTFYGILARFAIRHRSRGSEDSNCGGSAKKCETQVLREDGSLGDNELCFGCGRCEAIWHRGAIRF